MATNFIRALSVAVLGCGAPSSDPGPGDNVRSDGAQPDDASTADDALPPVDAAIAGCTPASLLAERAGFGRNATGGDPSMIYHVTTLADDLSGSGNTGSLRRAAQSATPWWIVFDVDGVITSATPLRVKSYKTIDGRGRDVTLRGELKVSSESHIIINDVRLKNDLAAACSAEGDAVLLTGPGTTDPSTFLTSDIWLHHVDLFHSGDGLLDLRGATNVTVSWSHFYEHRKGSLMWRDSASQDTPGMQVTMHHNFFDRISWRGPQFLFGKLHYVNNYQFEWFYYGAGCLGGAQCASENNIFEARASCVSCTDPSPCGEMEFLPDFTRAFVNDWDGNGLGRIRSSGDLLLGGATIAVNDPSAVFDPASMYSFVAEPATAQLADRIRTGAGPRTTMTCNF